MVIVPFPVGVGVGVGVGAEIEAQTGRKSREVKMMKAGPKRTFVSKSFQPSNVYPVFTKGLDPR